MSVKSAAMAGFGPQPKYMEMLDISAHWG
jgi:hypothetical protein